VDLGNTHTNLLKQESVQPKVTPMGSFAAARAMVAIYFDMVSCLNEPTIISISIPCCIVIFGCAMCLAVWLYISNLWTISPFSQKSKRKTLNEHRRAPRTRSTSPLHRRNCIIVFLRCDFGFYLITEMQKRNKAKAGIRKQKRRNWKMQEKDRKENE